MGFCRFSHQVVLLVGHDKLRSLAPPEALAIYHQGEPCEEVVQGLAVHIVPLPLAAKSRENLREMALKFSRFLGIDLTGLSELLGA